MSRLIETFSEGTGDSLSQVQAGLASAEARLDALEADAKGSAERAEMLAIEVEAVKGAKKAEGLSVSFLDWWES
jgi:hypothetical protein